MSKLRKLSKHDDYYLQQQLSQNTIYQQTLKKLKTYQKGKLVQVLVYFVCYPH